MIRITGPDARSFLQNLVTNDVTRLDAGLVYAALLTPQGKLRGDFFLVPDGDAILLDCVPVLEQPLFASLSMYRLRADVQMEQIERPASTGLGPAPDGAFQDPRHPALGWRAYDGRPSQPFDMDAIRVAAVVPMFGPDLMEGDYILEAQFERLGGVDFKKGCYVGQEVTARMKHKTELRKGWAQVGISGSAQPGTEITQDGKSVGRLGTVSGDRALAYLRFDRARPDMQALGSTISYP